MLWYENGRRQRNGTTLHWNLSPSTFNPVGKKIRSCTVGANGSKFQINGRKENRRDISLPALSSHCQIYCKRRAVTEQQDTQTLESLWTYRRSLSVLTDVWRREQGGKNASGSWKTHSTTWNCRGIRRSMKAIIKEREDIIRFVNALIYNCTDAFLAVRGSLTFHKKVETKVRFLLSKEDLLFSKQKPKDTKSYMSWGFFHSSADQHDFELYINLP